MPARLAIWLTVTSSDPARPISVIVAFTSAALRIGSIPTFGMRPAFPDETLFASRIFIDSSIKKNAPDHGKALFPWRNLF